MSFVLIGACVRRFITAMSSLVLVALLVPLAMQGDGGARLALVTTALVMLVWRHSLPATAAGILAAAVFRTF